MKAASLKLDCSTDTAEIVGEKIKLISSGPGHYCVPLTKMLITDDGETHQLSSTMSSSTMSCFKRKVN